MNTATVDRPKKKRGRKYSHKPQRERPFCPVHLTQMFAGSSTRKTVYYYCPVQDCDQSHQHQRSGDFE